MAERLAKLRFASARAYGIAAGMALVASVVLDRVGTHGPLEPFFVGVLFGLGLGLGIFALGVFARRRLRG